MKKPTSVANAKPVLKGTSKNTSAAGSFSKPTASSSAKNVGPPSSTTTKKSTVITNGQENTNHYQQATVVNNNSSLTTNPDAAAPSSTFAFSTSKQSSSSSSASAVATKFGHLDRYEFSDDHLSIEADFSSRKLISATIGGIEYRTTAAGGNNEIGVGAFSKIYKAAPSSNNNNNNNNNNSTMVALRVTTSDLTSRLARELKIHEFLLEKQTDEKSQGKFDGIVRVYGGGVLPTSATNLNNNHNNNNNIIRQQHQHQDSANQNQQQQRTRMFTAIQAMELLQPETLYDFCRTYPFSYSASSSSSTYNNNNNNNAENSAFATSATSTTLVDLYELMLECAAPVAALHSVGIMHRDIKPSNFIFAGNNGRVKLIDFGIACGVGEELPPCELRVGSPAFCAPEVAANFLRSGDVEPLQQVTAALDVYSLGVVFYVMLEGCGGATPYQDEHRPLDRKVPLGERPLHELAGTHRTVRILQRARGGEWYWSAKFRQRMSLLEAKKRNTASFPMVSLLEMKSLVESMMATDPAKRVTAQEVCDRLRGLIAVEEEAFEAHQQLQAQKQERKLARMTASPSIINNNNNNNNNSQEKNYNSYFDPSSVEVNDDNNNNNMMMTMMPSVSTTRQTVGNAGSSSVLLSRQTILMHNNHNNNNIVTTIPQTLSLRSRSRQQFFNLVTSPQSPFLNRRSKKRTDDEEDMCCNNENNNIQQKQNEVINDDHENVPPAAVALAIGQKSFTRYDNDGDDDDDYDHEHRKNVVTSSSSSSSSKLKQDEAPPSIHQQQLQQQQQQQHLLFPLTKAASAKIQREFAASHKKLLAEEHEAWELLAWLHESQAKQATHAHTFRRKVLKVGDASEGFYCDLCMKKCSPPTAADQQQHDDDSAASRLQFCSMHCSCDMDVCLSCFESYTARRTCECCNKKFSWLKDIQSHECAGRKTERLSALLLIANTNANEHQHDDSRRRDRDDEKNEQEEEKQENNINTTRKSRRSAKIVAFAVSPAVDNNNNNNNNNNKNEDDFDLVQEEDGVTYEGVGPKKPFNTAEQIPEIVAKKNKKTKTATIAAQDDAASSSSHNNKQQQQLPIQQDLPIPTRKSSTRCRSQSLQNNQNSQQQQNNNNADNDQDDVPPFSSSSSVIERKRSRSRSKVAAHQQEAEKLPLFWVRRCRFVSKHESPRIADCFFYICQPGRHGAIFTSTAFPFHSVICSIPEGIAWIIHNNNNNNNNKTSSSTTTTTYTVERMKVSDIRAKFHRSDPHCRAVDTITELAVEDNNFLKARRSVQNEVVSIAATNAITPAMDGRLLSRVADYPLVFVEDFSVDVAVCQTGVTVLELSDGRRQTIGGKPNMPRFELHGYKIEVVDGDEDDDEAPATTTAAGVDAAASMNDGRKSKIVNIVELFDEANVVTTTGSQKRGGNNNSNQNNNRFGLNGIQLFDPSTTGDENSSRRANSSSSGSQTSFEKELADIAKRLGFKF